MRENDVMGCPSPFSPHFVIDTDLLFTLQVFNSLNVSRAYPTILLILVDSHCRIAKHLFLCEDLGLFSLNLFTYLSADWCQDSH